MAEPVQILTHSDSLPSPDDTIEQSLGNFGWMQFVQSLIVSLSMFFDAQQSFISIYTDALPSWHCTSTSLSNHTRCSPDSDICSLPSSSWSWDGPSSTTIISQWSLHCASSFITGLPQSSFFMGCFLGGFLLATFADSSLGRKNMLCLSCFTMSVASTIVVFSTNVWTYSALKFLIGFLRSSIGTCCMVLLIERVRKEWRFRVGVLYCVWFAIGFLSLPAIAYVNRDSSWKYLYLWTSVPAICYSIFAYIFVRESPRWLLMQGREKEAMAILKGVTTEGGGSLTSTLLKVQYSKQNASIRELWVKSWAFQRLLAVMVLGFGIGMVYFGMPLNVGNLGFNIYLAVVFNALLEIPAFTATYFLDNCRRKPSILAFTVSSGICSLMCVVMGNELQTAKLGLALVSYFSVCSAFNVLLIYVIELFPTSVRNTATSMARQALVFGAIFSPFLISEGRKNDLFSYGLFGVVLLGSGFSLVYLPETRGIALCDTMDQQERKECITV